MSGLHMQLARRADELLGDREWHNYERTVRELIKLVPPGMALRRNEKERVEGLSQSKGKPRTRPRERDELIELGARSIVRDFLKNKLVFEVEPRSFLGPGRDYDRRLRMLRQHSSLRGDHYRVQRDKLEAENSTLRDQVKMLRDELINLGHQDLADKWAPEA